MATHDKLSLSYILNPALSSSSAMEEDNDQQDDNNMMPPASPSQWQSCRPTLFNHSFALPSFSYLAQQQQQHQQQQQMSPLSSYGFQTPATPDHKQGRVTYPLRRDISPPNIAFYQAPTPQQLQEQSNNPFFSHNEHNITTTTTTTTMVSSEPMDMQISRDRRANTAPPLMANNNNNSKYRAKKFTSANNNNGLMGSKRQPPRKISPEQLSYLEKAFEQDRMPDTTTKMRISQELNLSPQQVKIWFQNKRARMRRLERAMNPNEEENQAGGITFHFFEGNDFVHEY